MRLMDMFDGDMYICNEQHISGILSIRDMLNWHIMIMEYRMIMAPSGKLT